MPSPRIPTYAAAQSLAELSIGSLVHAFHLPLGGHLLSLNQALILTFACKGVGNRREGVEVASGVANVTAVLKSLSPAGKKLSPMLAISMQGLLYAIGVALAGANVLGVALGAVLLSLWAFCHPILMAYLVFGSRLFAAIEKLWRDLAGTLGIDPEVGIWILGALVVIKMLLGASLAVVGWVSSARFEKRYFEYLEKRRRPRPDPKAHVSASRGVLRDLLSPLFLVSFGLSVAFLVLGQNANWVQTVWYALRVLAVALIVFWASRALPASGILKRFPQIEATANQLFRQRSRD